MYSRELKKPNGKRWICHNCSYRTNVDNNSDVMENLLKMILDLQKSINFMSDKYEEVKEENKEMLRLLKEMKKERAELVTENKLLKEEIVYIRKEVNTLKYFLNNEEQQKLKNNIEVKGIPLDTVDDQKLIENALKVIGIELTSSQVKIQRVKETKDKPKNTIKLSLEDEEIKKNIITAARNYYKSKGPLTTVNIGMNGVKHMIYFNEELTNYNKYLLGKAKEIKKKGYKFVWYKNGKIFVRKNESDLPIAICNEEDIQGILNKT